MSEVIIEFCIAFAFAVLGARVITGLLAWSNVLAKKIKPDDEGLLGLAICIVGLFIIGLFAVIIIELKD